MPVLRWVGVAATVLALGTLFATPPDAPVKKTDAFLDAETTGLLSIELTECFDDPEYDRRADDRVVVYVPCADGADNQAYNFVYAPDGDFDRPSVAALAWDRCGQVFDKLWKGAGRDGLDYYPTLPTAETWADGDRVIMCVVYRPSGRLPDSVLPLAGR
ncbi:hypothetical protein [Asanoa siamensis]|uniref:Regulator of septum formation n=1 Tax=Asanoa siamensis TaxID=926357 RepID=A0ABQ4CNF1_9ACTN|nr:hypothetical protein [Asanoa siamensis]GIF72816.1 hypothetical protein Asi02nite_23340 [Asanoa siamensis]